MSTREILNRVIIVGFLILVGFALAYAVYVKSFIGILLAMISLGATVYFLYIAAKAKEEMEMELDKEL